MGALLFSPPEWLQELPWQPINWAPLMDNTGRLAHWVQEVVRRQAPPDRERRGGDAATLMDGLRERGASSPPHGSLRTLVQRGGAALELGGIVAAVGTSLHGALRPQALAGTCGDHNGWCRAANVVTSLPYVLLGARCCRERKTDSGRLWGVSLMGVGVASVMFHAHTGRWRHWGRRLDFWTIAFSSSLLTRAIFPRLPPHVTAAAVAATPFAPFQISAMNTLALETKFLFRARQAADAEGVYGASLARAQRVHSACAAAGLCLYAIEDALPHVPLLHAGWHLLSAGCCATTNSLLSDQERQYPEFTASSLEV